LSLTAALLLVPAPSRAQATGSIAGVVKDTSGAVLPGVTVEAASPALIEKVRSVTSDRQGNYKIVDLRAGTYTVTFTLSGFSTVRREGVDVGTGVTATVNAELKVGALEETVTVTGASPVVDVQNTRTQAILNRETLDTLPTGRSYGGYAALIVGASTGATQDVGGNFGENVSAIDIHGTRGQVAQKLFYDGMSISVLTGDTAAGSRLFFVNQLVTQEMVIETGSMTAEATTGGVQSNIVPKDGGNTFTGVMAGAYANNHLQSNNLTDTLIARGVTAAATIKQIYDFGVAWGGPIRQDKAWFFTGTRYWGAENYIPGTYFNKTLGTLTYTPDLGRPAYVGPHDKDVMGRLTVQLTPKQKISTTTSVQFNCMCNGGFSSPSAPETGYHIKAEPVVLSMGTWSYPSTNRLLFQAGGAFMYGKARITPAGGLDEISFGPFERLSLTAIPVTELSTGLNYGARAVGLDVTDYGELNGSQVNFRGSVSYVTGSHAAKLGFTLLRGLAGDR